MKAVIDTNALRASVPPRGQGHWLYRAFVEERFDWYLSTEIRFEYEEILSATYSVELAELVLATLDIAPNVFWAEPFIAWNLVSGDPDDNKFADLAISIGADYLVSNDKHLLALSTLTFPPIRVVTLDQFKEIVYPE